MGIEVSKRGQADKEGDIEPFNIATDARLS